MNAVYNIDKKLKNLLVKIKPDSIAELANIITLNSDIMEENIPSYIARKNGAE